MLMFATLELGSAAIESALPPLSEPGPCWAMPAGIGERGALCPAEEPWVLLGGTSYSSSSLPGAAINPLV